MPHALLFLVAPEPLLPEASTAEELELAQLGGIGGAVALRMFRTPEGWEGQLDELVADGLANADGLDPFPPPPASRPAGDQPPAPERRRLICDAVVPHLDPHAHWIGIYAIEGDPRDPAPPASLPASNHPLRSLAIRSVRCLDRFPLREADNETCWFYPTEDGTFLAWENQRRVQTLPGFLPERPVQAESVAFERSDLKVLWSLMADDLALTCVGLTCRGRRIEWPVAASQPEPFATWTAFQVDSSAESTYRELAAITVFQA